MYLGVIRSRPTAYSKVTIHHNYEYLNRKNVIQNKNEDKNNINLINLTFIYCTCKIENHKLSLVKTMDKRFLIKIIYNITHMKSINDLSLVKTVIEPSIINNISPRSLYYLCSL
jgi:hypothetical protein